MSKKKLLIKDIQNLLNKHADTTIINKDLLDFMDEDTLLSIINSLLKQKDDLIDADTEWLNKFKIYKK